MNGFEMLTQSYEKVLEQNNPKYDQENIKGQIASLRSMAWKSEEEINGMFETGVFNEICTGYIYAALQNCNIDAEKASEVVNELKWLFDTIVASQAREKLKA